MFSPSHPPQPFAHQGLAREKVSYQERMEAEARGKSEGRGGLRGAEPARRKA